MEFTCIKCEFKFHETKMDTDERMCYDCVEEDDTEPTTADEYNKVQDYGPPIQWLIQLENLLVHNITQNGTVKKDVTSFLKRKVFKKILSVK